MRRHLPVETLLGHDVVSSTQSVGDAESHRARHADEPDNGSRSGPDVREAMRQPTLIGVPVGLRGALAVPGIRAIVGVGLIGFIVVAVLLGRWWWSERAADGEILAPGQPVVPTAGGSPGGEAELPATEQSGVGSTVVATAGAPAVAADQGEHVGLVPDGTVKVHVAGKVRKPGVVSVSAGARVVDAVSAAGGLSPGANPATVNLARAVVDGEQIVILAVGETPAGAAAAAAPTPSSSAGTALTGPGATPGAAAGGQGPKVNLNTADQAELESLPGVGPVLASRILAWRTENGRFTAIDELGEVSGVGEKTLQQLTPLVTV